LLTKTRPKALRQSLSLQLLKSTIIADGKIESLTPGMATSVEIKTEQRRIIEYLLTPLLKYRGEALRER
jgi:hemolysin D